MAINVGRTPETLNMSIIGNSDNDLVIPMATVDGTPISLTGLVGVLTFQKAGAFNAMNQEASFVWHFTPLQANSIEDMETVEFAVTDGSNRRVLARGIVRIK